MAESESQEQHYTESEYQEQHYAKSIELPHFKFRNLKNAKRFAIDIGELLFMILPSLLYSYSTYIYIQILLLRIKFVFACFINILTIFCLKNYF